MQCIIYDCNSTVVDTTHFVHKRGIYHLTNEVFCHFRKLWIKSELGADFPELMRKSVNDADGAEAKMLAQYHPLDLIELGRDLAPKIQETA